MIQQKNSLSKGKIEDLFDRYKKIIEEEERLEDLDLISGFFNPLRAEINHGRFDYELVKVWYSATNLLDLKIQKLLSKALQQNGIKEPGKSESGEETLSKVVTFLKPIQKLAIPIFADNISNAFIELMIHRRRKQTLVFETEIMSYDPKEIEPISIEADKNKLLHQIKTLRQSTIDFNILLKEKRWEEAILILNILLHLAHERKIKLYQNNFPTGKIVISYEGKEN